MLYNDCTHTLICICSPLWPQRTADSSFEVWRIGKLHRDHVLVLFVFVSNNYLSQSNIDWVYYSQRSPYGLRRLVRGICLGRKRLWTSLILLVYITCLVLNNSYPHLYISFMLHWYADSCNIVSRFREDSFFCICMSCCLLLFACIQHKHTQWLCIV